MKTMYLLRKNKRALSDVVAYALLIAITLSLSVLVYNWLEFQFGGEEVEECPNGVNIVLSSYSCSSGPEGVLLGLNLKNKGRFNVTGYTVRVHNRTGANFGIYSLDLNGSMIPAGQGFFFEYNFSDSSLYPEEIQNMNTVTFLEIQPFYKKRLMCKALSTQNILCS